MVKHEVGLDRECRVEVLRLRLGVVGREAVTQGRLPGVDAGRLRQRVDANGEVGRVAGAETAGRERRGRAAARGFDGGNGDRTLLAAVRQRQARRQGRAGAGGAAVDDIGADGLKRRGGVAGPEQEGE